MQEWIHKKEKHTLMEKMFFFNSPGGHKNAIFWEMEKYRGPQNFKSIVKYRSARISNVTGLVKYLHQINYFSRVVDEDVKFFTDLLGFRVNELTVLGGSTFGAWLTTTGKDHDLALVKDPSNIDGRFNHLALYVEDIGQWIITMETLIDNGVQIEVGPVRHGQIDSYGYYVIESGGSS